MWERPQRRHLHLHQLPPSAPPSRSLARQLLLAFRLSVEGDGGGVVGFGPSSSGRRLRWGAERAGRADTRRGNESTFQGGQEELEEVS